MYISKLVRLHSYKVSTVLLRYLLSVRNNFIIYSPRISSYRKHIIKGSLLLTSVHSMATNSTEEDSVIKESDDLMEKDKIRESYLLLKKYSDSTNVAIQWRLARICYRLGKYHAKDQTEAKQLAETGLIHADKAISIDGSSYAAYRWKGVLLNWSLDFEGYKKKIEKSFEIRENFDKASELNPSDSTTKHMIGRWCYEVSNVPWYMRKAAQYIFATPPSSSYEEALKYFEDAEKLNPGFYVPNWLYIGKCYISMGQKERAREWLTKASEYSSDNMLGDCVEAIEEAKKLLGGL